MALDAPIGAAEAATEASVKAATASGMAYRYDLRIDTKFSPMTLIFLGFHDPRKTNGYHVAPNGSLVLAGILERQADELITAYAPYCTLSVADREDGWILMTATI